MQSKSSTSLAIISILAILIVFFIGVSNVEDAPVRKPFPTKGATGDVFKELSQTSQKAESTKASSSADVLPSLQMTNSNNIEFQTPPLPAKTATPDVSENSVNSTKPANLDKIEVLVKNINSESLMKAGFTNFVVKPQPFNGKLFDLFDLSMLSYLNIVDKVITENQNGNDSTVMRAYEFELTEKDQTEEVYSFLKAKIKDELGVTINETNQFGLSSFFINFNEPKNDAFLVVKTRTNVYALSYPKAKSGEKSYFDLVSKLFSELI